MRNLSLEEYYKNETEDKPKLYYDEVLKGNPRSVYRITGGGPERENIQTSELFFDLENIEEYNYGFGTVFSFIIPLVDKFGKKVDTIQFIKDHRSGRYEYGYQSNWEWTQTYSGKDIVRPMFFFDYRSYQKELKLRVEEIRLIKSSLQKRIKFLESELEKINLEVIENL